MISWRDVAVTFGKSRVVGPLSLEVSHGEWLGLIGPNGAGKSTLLKAAVGVVEYEGLVDVGDGDRRRGLDIAWMPQRPRLPEEMSVSDYVLLGRTPHLGYVGGESQHDFDAVTASLERLDLLTFAGRRLGTLSGGEAQRTVMARALAQEAPVLLLDDPTSSLDIGHALEVLEILDELRRHDGLTVVTAVHDLTLAGRFSDRLAMMASGVIVSDGDPSAVLTEANLTKHYGAGIKVVNNGDGPTVIPTRIERG